MLDERHTAPGMDFCRAVPPRTATTRHGDGSGPPRAPHHRAPRTTPVSQRRYPPPAPPLGAGAALTPAPKAKGPVAVRTPLVDGIRGPSLCSPGTLVRGAYAGRTVAVGRSVPPLPSGPVCAVVVRHLWAGCVATVSDVTGVTERIRFEWATFFGHGRSCT
ncbi:hypothetical protein HEK616_62610 [Streptomyces nigrescens]|uniref:Uncharacterized protein n=1 Tax=Streptomyces nigrescens TaxID=1920 RepID=A0ABM8A295_STRNI|nr:hypothetical protein HEK616_62610 [Streptomyces nigrescens]